jgi:hypothetical protein
MLLYTATEEIGHIEVLATAVAMNVDGLPSEKIDDVVTNPLVSARMGGVESRHHLSGGLSGMPADANGVPFNAACIDVGGNLLAIGAQRRPRRGRPRAVRVRVVRARRRADGPGRALAVGAVARRARRLLLRRSRARLGQEPELIGGPPSVHGGVEATRDGSSGNGGVMDIDKDTVQKLS